MYSDRLEHAAKQSAKDRLIGNANLVGNSARRRPVTGKRPRQDDKWEHDMYEKIEPELSRSKAPRLDTRDLRLKLRKKSTQQLPPNGGVRDLREIISGSMHARLVDVNQPRTNPEVEPPVKRIRKSVIGKAPLVESRKVSDSIAKKKSQRKAGASVDGFLRSLGLEKYHIQFKAEEIDMTAIQHLTDEDLKSMGLPMGPRKKILLALN